VSIHKKQLRDLIRTVLLGIDPPIKYSNSAENLLLLTAAQESHAGTYIKQIGGPALGIFQMEPDTHYDIWMNYIQYNPGLRTIANKFSAFDDPLYHENDFAFRRNAQQLVWNLNYAVILARIHYYRVPEPLPEYDDVLGLAEYWKQHYNTPLGRGTVKEAVENYERLVLE